MRIKLFFLITSTFLFGGINAQPATEKAPEIFQTLIFPMQPQHTHGSSIVTLPNGDILAAWFQGSGERTADDVKIMGARLKKGSQGLVHSFC